LDLFDEHKKWPRLRGHFVSAMSVMMMMVVVVVVKHSGLCGRNRQNRRGGGQNC